MRTPDAISGARGTARLASLTAAELAAAPAHLSLWLVHAPGYHIAWDHYLCTVCHLRDVPGVEPAHKTYPGAEHELMVFAAKFDKRPEDERSPNCWMRNRLVPQNIVFQFHGMGDDGARQLLAKLVGAFCTGALSPDTDYRRMQQAALQQWVNAS